MKYFLDTEFMEHPFTIQLISIGIVAEDGREFYAESNQFDPEFANLFVKQHVFPQLKYDPYDYNSRSGSAIWENKDNDGDIEMIGAIPDIKEWVLKFIGSDTPEFWGYFADYDWVAFCWIFGPMTALPKDWPMYCRDLKQLADDVKKPRFKEPKGEHNALADARWNKAFYEYLKEDD